MTTYIVPSSTDPRRTYTVTHDGRGTWMCDCPQRRIRGITCKHITALRNRTAPAPALRLADIYDDVPALGRY